LLGTELPPQNEKPVPYPCFQASQFRKLNFFPLAPPPNHNSLDRPAGVNPRDPIQAFSHPLVFLLAGVSQKFPPTSDISVCQRFPACRTPKPEYFVPLPAAIAPVEHILYQIFSPCIIRLRYLSDSTASTLLVMICEPPSQRLKFQNSRLSAQFGPLRSFSKLSLALCRAFYAFISLFPSPASVVWHHRCNDPFSGFSLLNLFYVWRAIIRPWQVRFALPCLRELIPLVLQLTKGGWAQVALTLSDSLPPERDSKHLRSLHGPSRELGSIPTNASFDGLFKRHSVGAYNPALPKP